MSEGRRAILDVLDKAEKPLGPKMLHKMLNAKGIEMKNGAVREMLSQMVKDGQAQNLGRGQYVRRNFQEIPDNADDLTNEGTEVP